MYTLTVEDGFAAAHQLRGYKGKCENLHGHNWRVELSVTGMSLNDTGLVMDFGDLKRILREIIGLVDHTNLNELAPFEAANPSSENLAAFFFAEAKKRLERLSDSVKMLSVTVWESATAHCTYTE